MYFCFDEINTFLMTVDLNNFYSCFWLLLLVVLKLNKRSVWFYVINMF